MVARPKKVHEAQLQGCASQHPLRVHLALTLQLGLHSLFLSQRPQPKVQTKARVVPGEGEN